MEGTNNVNRSWNRNLMHNFHLISGKIGMGMHKVFFFSLFWCLFLVTSAQVSTADKESPQKSVPAFELKWQSEQAYTSQSELWKQVALTQPSNAEAWLNWYKAERYSNFSEHSRKISKESQYALNDIISNMEQHVPASPAFHIAAYLNGNKSPEAFEHLVKAHDLQPLNVELFDDMLARAVIMKDATGQVKFANKISTAGLYSSAEMEYNRNVLNSAGSGGVLVTYGNKDTYPILITQLLNGERTDVRVICLDWIGSEVYRKSVADIFGIPSNSLDGDESQFLKTILSSKSGKMVYLSLTIPPTELKKYVDQCYLEGLAFRYSDVSLNNLPVLAQKWDQQFQKVHLKDNVALNRNYILPLTELAVYYRELGEQKKSDGFEKTLQEVAEIHSRSSKITKYIE